MKSIINALLFLRETKLFLLIRGIFFIMSKIPFLLVLLMVGFFAFVINDQGIDLMIAFGKLDLFHPYVLSFLGLLIIWSGIAWYVARVTLSSANLSRIVKEEKQLRESLKDPACGKDCALQDDHIVVIIDSQYKKMIGLLAKIIPRILAALPYLIFIKGYWKANGINNGGMIKILVVALIGVLHVTYLCYRTDIWSKKGKPSTKITDTNEKMPDNRFALQEIKYPKTVLQAQMLTRTTVLVAIVFVGTFIYALFIAKSVPSLNGKPGLIILCGLIFYSILGLLIIYFSNLVKFPLFTFLLVLALFIALPFNNNHALYKIKDESLYSQINARLPDSIYFKEWLNYKLGNNLLFEKDSIIPVFIVAAEGGGIRACYWTSQVLKNLHIAHPELYGNTFAVTGASGGTVGLGFFYNYLFEKEKGDSSLLSKPGFYASLDTITASDFLSGVTYGFLFPDLLQRVLPWPIASFDRAKFLGNSFSKSFATHTGEKDGKNNLMDQSVLAAWQSSARPFNQPVILFNSLYVEEGQKALFAPYKISKQYYEDALDILDATQMLVPMKEAILSSSRFPLITPPGLMMQKTGGKDKKFGHLVDGGYFENTAIQTAQQTVMMMKSMLRQMNIPGKKIVPVIISMQYGSDTSIHKEPMKGGYEAAPLQGGINTLFRWINGAKAMNVKLDKDLNTINFKLTKFEGDKIPLGWYLSEPARNLVEKYARLDHYKVRVPYAALGKYLK